MQSAAAFQHWLAERPTITASPVDVPVDSSVRSISHTRAVPIHSIDQMNVLLHMISIHYKCLLPFHGGLFTITGTYCR